MSLPLLKLPECQVLATKVQKNWVGLGLEEAAVSQKKSGVSWGQVKLLGGNEEI